MADAHADDQPSDSTTDADPTAEPATAWERAFDGPPINPRSALIYHDDGKVLRSRHRS